MSRSFNEAMERNRPKPAKAESPKHLLGRRSLFRTRQSDEDNTCVCRGALTKLWKGIGRSTNLNGGVAQLGEHLPCKQGVRSSILLISTSPRGMFVGIPAEAFLRIAKKDIIFKKLYLEN